jgi:hypothetical protein
MVGSSAYFTDAGAVFEWKVNINMSIRDKPASWLFYIFQSMKIELHTKSTLSSIPGDHYYFLTE